MRTPFCSGMSRKQFEPGSYQSGVEVHPCASGMWFADFHRYTRYLLTHTLSLYSEYKEHTGVSVKFFGLKKEGKGIIVEESETLAGIQSNPILEEYAAFYDLEQQFISKYE